MDFRICTVTSLEHVWVLICTVTNINNKFAIDLHIFQITCKIGYQSCKILFAKFVLTLHMQYFWICTAASLQNERKCGRHLSIMQMIAELVTRWYIGLDAT